MQIDSTITNFLGIRAYKSLESRFTEVHKGRYTYENYVYKNATTKGLITCKIHGDFLQKQSDHLAGCGCQVCGRKKSLEASHTKTKEIILGKMKAVHGNRYDYSKVVYKDTRTKVEIICNIHGCFMQTPCNHMMGHGCLKCATKGRANKMRITTEEFIVRAKSVHGDLYDYSLVDYRQMNKKIILLCKKHGEFLQSPASHLVGVGCPTCGEIYRRKKWFNMPTTIYYIEVEKNDKTYYKIGITTKTVKERYECELRHGMTIRILFTKLFSHGKKAYELEQYILNRYKDYRYKGETKILNGGDSELFTKNVLTTDDITEINNL